MQCIISATMLRSTKHALAATVNVMNEKLGVTETDLIFGDAEQVSQGHRCCDRCSRVAIYSTAPPPWRICSQTIIQES